MNNPAFPVFPLPVREAENAVPLPLEVPFINSPVLFPIALQSHSWAKLVLSRVLDVEADVKEEKITEPMPDPRV